MDDKSALRSINRKTLLMQVVDEVMQVVDEVDKQWRNIALWLIVALFITSVSVIIVIVSLGMRLQELQKIIGG